MWDYTGGNKLCHWRVERGIGGGSLGRSVPRITALDFVNAHDACCFLVTGSEDGTVRLWSNYTNSGKYNIVINELSLVLLLYLHSLLCIKLKDIYFFKGIDLDCLVFLGYFLNCRL